MTTVFTAPTAGLNPDRDIQTITATLVIDGVTVATGEAMTPERAAKAAFIAASLPYPRSIFVSRSWRFTSPDFSTMACDL